MIESTKPKKKQVVIVGAGYFGLKRLKACLELKKHITVVGVVEKNADLAQQIKEKHQVPVFSSLDEVPSNQMELAIISTPNNTHSELAIKALSLGAHVLCEKPLATSSAEATKIAKAAVKYKRLVKTGSNHRFFASVQKALQLYQKGEIGELLSFRGSIGTTGNQTAHSWFWDRKVSGGGTFIDNGCHLLDIARMFMGDFTSAFGHTDKLFWTESKVEDIGTGIFLTKNKRQALITSSWFQWHGYLYFELWGDKGYIIIDNRDGDYLILGKKDQPLTTTLDFTNYPKNSYHQEILYFIECINQKKQPSPNAEDGAKVIKMIESVYASTSSKSWVKL